jgi:hypothetical protein
MVDTIDVGRTERITLNAGTTIAIAAAANSSGRVRRQNNANGGIIAQDWFRTLAAGDTIRLGPYPVSKHYEIETQLGSLTYTFSNPDNDFATQLGNVEKFAGSITLTAEDNGKLFRCEDASNVTVTVPNNLPEGFNAGFLMWGAGTVTIAAGSGATNRSTTTALTTQFDMGSLIVGKNSTGSAAEFALGGAFA